MNIGNGSLEAALLNLKSDFTGFDVFLKMNYSYYLMWFFFSIQYKCPFYHSHPSKAEHHTETTATAPRAEQTQGAGWALALRVRRTTAWLPSVQTAGQQTAGWFHRVVGTRQPPREAKGRPGAPGGDSRAPGDPRGVALGSQGRP